MSENTSFQTGATGGIVVQMGSLLQKCKLIARALKVSRPSRGIPSLGLDLVPPNRELADTFASMYFRSFESTYRIIHIPSFWEEYQTYWDNPESTKTGQVLKILLVVGIGSSLSQDQGADVRLNGMVQHWIYAAQTWLSGPMEKDRLDLTGLQVYCLVILARQIFAVGGDLVWMSMGSLVHIAMQIGCHRDPKHLPQMSVLQAELRRRLWATILEMVMQSSLDSAMPPRISLDEFDIGPPANINDAEIDKTTTELHPHPKETYTDASVQLILLDSLPTRLRILQLLNGIHNDLSYLEVLALSSEITDAYRAHSSFLRDKTLATPFQRNMLDYLVRRFVIPLHSPFASQARTNPLFYYSRKVSLDAALTIISPEPDDGFSQLMAMGGGLFREGFRLAGSAIALELLAHVEGQRIDGTLHRNDQYRGILKQGLLDMVSRSTDRIRQGETNVKDHMFLSMILAQVAATEASESPEFKIAQSARDSLELCYDLLRTRLNALSLLPPDETGPLSTDLESSSELLGADFDLSYFFSNPSFSN
jgi:hypothetical protein